MYCFWKWIIGAQLGFELFDDGESDILCIDLLVVRLVCVMPRHG